MRTALIVAMAASGLAPPPSQLTGQECTPLAPRISAEQRGEQVDVFVEVRGHAPVVVVLDAELVHMHADRRLPHVATYRAGQRVRALTFRARPVPGQRWTYQYNYRWAWGDHQAVHAVDYRYRLPFDGTAFRLIQGPDGGFSHEGQHAYDWAMPEGTPVLAAREGLVVETCDLYHAGAPDRALVDLANYIHVQHADGTLARYIHLMPGGVRVRPGDRVARGQVIGLSGNTGFSAGPHLHFEVAQRRADLQLETVPLQFGRIP